MAANYAHSIDANQPEIIQAFEGMGVTVHDQSHAGRGLPDLLCWDIAGTFLVECKKPHGRLSTAEQRFWDKWPGDKYICYGYDHAIQIANERRRRSL